MSWWSFFCCDSLCPQKTTEETEPLKPLVSDRQESNLTSINIGDAKEYGTQNEHREFKIPEGYRKPQMRKTASESNLDDPRRFQQTPPGTPEITARKPTTTVGAPPDRLERDHTEQQAPISQAGPLFGLYDSRGNRLSLQEATRLQGLKPMTFANLLPKNDDSFDESHQHSAH